MFLSKTSSQPAGLKTLFFTELWERMSYYGMRAMLVLFMVDAIGNGGLGINDKNAMAIYGIYTAAVYLLALPGGWIADRLIGAQRSVFWGGVIIAAGHFSMAVPSLYGFFLGLTLIAIGTGLLKPNISTLVGSLYDKEDRRRDAGFTLFYMGINMGAVLGPIVCGGLGQSEAFGWHWGFGAAGVGMVLGLLQYHFGRHKLAGAGQHASAPYDKPQLAWSALGVGLFLVLLFLAATGLGWISLSAHTLAKYTAQLITLIFFIYFFYVIIFGKLTAEEKKSSYLILVLCLASALFWSGFEQAGSSLNVFADRYVNNTIASLGVTIPSSWYQSLNAAFIILLAPLFGMLWVGLAKRYLEPSAPVKFAFGLFLLALGFVMMVFAAKVVSQGDKAAPYWLVLTYLFHTMGELCLSPVGLSAVSRLAPKSHASQMMGLWFCASALGNIIAGLLAGNFDSDSVQQFPAMYMQIVIFGAVAGFLLLIFSKPLSRLDPSRRDNHELGNSGLDTPHQDSTNVQKMPL